MEINYKDYTYNNRKFSRVHKFESALIKVANKNYIRYIIRQINKVEMEENTMVINAIIADKESGIKEVHNLTFIKCMIFDSVQYSSIIELIKSCNWRQIDSLIEVSIQGFRQFLYIVKFKDQDQRSCAATLYDSDELWQDPQLIDIFFLTC